MAVDNLANLLTHIMNCKRIGKKEIEFMPVSNLMIEVLKIMKKEGYIEEFKIEKEGEFRKLRIVIGKINECKAIKPRFYVTKKEITKYMKRYLPAREVGIIIISTSQGLMTHKEAIEKGMGGVLIAYCY